MLQNRSYTMSAFNIDVQRENFISKVVYFN